MKKYALLLALLITGTAAQAQQEFDSLKGLKDVTKMIVTSDMFEMMSNIDLSTDNDEAKEYLAIIDQLKELRVYTTSNAKSRSALQAAADGFIKRGGLKTLMLIEEDDSIINMYMQPGSTDKRLKSLVMTINNGDDTVVMLLSGDVELDKIGKLTRTLNLPGSEELEKAAKKNR